jgi:hypothetical protein
MKKTLLLSAALVLGVAATGAALATPRLLEDRFAGWIDHDRDHGPAVSAGERFRVADRDHRRKHESRDHHRKHHDDDDDDDDDDDHGGRGGGRAGRPDVTGPSDPAAPVPDNGLFQGKARPKVEVN